MTEFESYVSDIPCIIRVTYWEPYLPPIIRADPGDSHPAEGGWGEWEILDLDGRPYPELESVMTEEERARINRTIFEHMEKQHDAD